MTKDDELVSRTMGVFERMKDTYTDADELIWALCRVVAYHEMWVEELEATIKRCNETV